MKAFEVSVNDERLCVAALDGPGSVDVMADIIHRPVHDPTTGKPIPGKVYPWLGLYVGGLTIDDAGASTMCTWVKRILAVGDEIRVRIIDTDSADAPTSREPTSADAENANRRRLYEELEREFGD